MRFQKRIKILPGLRLNLSKNGVSASLGPRGASLNVSSRGAKLTAGIPGTGLSHTETLTRRSSAPVVPPAPEAPSSRGRRDAWWTVFFIVATCVLWYLLARR